MHVVAPCCRSFSVSIASRLTASACLSTPTPTDSKRLLVRLLFSLDIRAIAEDICVVLPIFAELHHLPSFLSTQTMSCQSKERCLLLAYFQFNRDVDAMRKLLKGDARGGADAGTQRGPGSVHASKRNLQLFTHPDKCRLPKFAPVYQRSFVTAQDLAKCANVWDEAPDHASCQHNGGNVDPDLHAVKLLELLDLDETTPTQGETTTTVVAKIFITLRALLLHSDDCNRPALSPPVWLAAATAVLRKALEVAEQAPGSGGLRNRSDTPLVQAYHPTCRAPHRCADHAESAGGSP